MHLHICGQLGWQRGDQNRRRWRHLWCLLLYEQRYYYGCLLQCDRNQLLPLLSVQATNRSRPVSPNPPLFATATGPSAAFTAAAKPSVAVAKRSTAEDSARDTLAEPSTALASAAGSSAEGGDGVTNSAAAEYPSNLATAAGPSTAVALAAITELSAARATAAEHADAAEPSTAVAAATSTDSPVAPTPA